MNAIKQCSVTECGQPLLAKSLCRMHYKRQKKHGTTERLYNEYTVGQGDKFGRLTAIYKCPPSARTSWLCRCDCDREVVVLRDNLARGHRHPADAA